MDKNVSTHTDRSIIIMLLTLVRPYRYWMILSAVCAIAIAMCDVISVALIRELIDNILGGNLLVITKMVMLIAVTVLVGLIASYLMPYASGCFKSYTIRNLRNKAVEHVDKLQVSVKDDIHTGDITARLNNDLSMIEIFIGSLSNTLYMLLVIIVTFVYLFSIEWRLLVLSFISIPIALIVSDKLSEPMGKLHAQYYDYFAQSNTLMYEAIGGIAVLKAYNLEGVFHTKLKEKQTKALEIYNNKINVRSTLLMPIMFMIYELPYVLCSIYGGYLAVNGRLLASSLVAFILLLRYLVGPTSQLPKILMDIKSAIGAGSRIFELFGLPIEQMDGTSYKMKHDECAVEFDNVTFGYVINKEVLKNLNFKIKSGTSVALVGPSGCGKSTILNLICGFYQANSGTIHIYGNDIKNCNLFSLREQLAFVSQDTYLYTGTIMTSKFVAQSNKIALTTLERAHKNSQLSLSNYLFGIVSMIGIYLLGAYMVANGRLDFGSVVAMVTLQKGINFMFSNFGNFFAQLQSSLAGASRIFEILDQTVEANLNG